MIKKTLLLSFLLSFGFVVPAFSQVLQLEMGKTYLLSFDEDILNFQADEANLDAQILHTIFGDKQQMILELKTKNNSFLQVKTENNLYKYDVRNNSVASKELVEIDLPPVENLDIDIYTGD